MFVLNIPNVLTLMRVMLVPVFVACFYTDHTAMAFCAYVAASLTDMADGYLARKLNQITSFGKLMDPLADKLMQISMLTCLCSGGYIPWWVMFVLLGKEIIMVIGGEFLLKRRNVVVKSNWSGKLATVLLVTAIIAVYPWHGVETVTKIGSVLLYLGLTVSLYSMVNYGLLYVKNANQQTAH